MTAAETNADLHDALEFYAYVNGIKEKKDEWTAHGDLLKRVLDRLYDTPGCRSHYAGFDDSFACLPCDIIYEVVEGIDEPAQLELLEEVHGPWGDLAIKQQQFLEGCDPRFGYTYLNMHETPFYERWHKVLRDAPKLHGTLALYQLCGFVGSGEEFYSALRPNFYYLTLTYDFTKIAYTRNQLTHLRAFLVKQLESPCLRELDLKINGDLDLEKELFKFCLSDKFESFTWNYLSLTVGFIIQIYNAYKKKQVSPDRKTRRIEGSFDRSLSAMKEIVQTLKLKRQEKDRPDSTYSTFKRNDRTSGSDLSITIGYSSEYKGAHVTIELKHLDNGCANLSDTTLRSLEPLQKNQEGTEEDFADFDDYDHKKVDEGCDGDCELTSVDQFDWISEDCENCEGCDFCQNRCEFCGNCL